uniref:TFIIS N-terminal domain-containing protein n=1 Tax=Ciona savignyi TaxID=51511 RepID=H2YQF9_CIOSA
EGSNTMVSDFDLMMQRKKNERKGRRRKDGGTFISDADDIINAMLTKMREAAVADREANQLRKPALNKLKMLPTVIRHLKKQDLKESFVDMGMIAAVVDWLTLLPDRSLPHLSIRTELLKVLHDLPGVSSETLKTSGIGRAVMLLFKHPRETRENRESAGRLINKWSRPIFGLNDNFKSMSRGDREQRDLEHMPQSKRRRLSAGQSDGKREEEAGGEEGEQLRPGEQGFVMRARVPAPSHKDYVIRPKWKIGSLETEDGERFNRRSKSNKAKKDDRLEKHLKTFADRRKNSKMQRAVGISIEGSKMPL